MDKRTLFLAVSGVFVMIMVYFSMDILNKTTPPWKKNKQNQLIDIADTAANYTFADTIIYVYTVKRHENMEHIELKFNMKQPTIMQLNELATNNLKESQKILVKLRAVHEVAPNEFLEKIARKYQIDMKVIMKANGIGKADRLRAGQKLLIPSATKQ